MLPTVARDSVFSEGKGIWAFDNLTYQEFATLSGSNLSGEALGAQYYGAFVIGSDPNVIHMNIRVDDESLGHEQKESDA